MRERVVNLIFVFDALIGYICVARQRFPLQHSNACVRE